MTYNRRGIIIQFLKMREKHLGEEPQAESITPCNNYKLASFGLLPMNDSTTNL